MSRPRLRLAMLLLAVTGISGCASIYLNSPSLQTQTAVAADAFPDEATALGPFDDQLARLKDFAAKEDGTVADYWTAARDTHFARIIALDAAHDRPAVLKRQIDGRLVDLLGPRPFSTPADIAFARDDLANLQALAESQRRRFKVAAPDASQDLSCKAVSARISDAAATALTLSHKQADVALGLIAQACRQIEARQATITLAEGNFNGAGGELGEEQAALKATQVLIQDPAIPPFGHVAEIQQAIVSATSFNSSGSAQAQLGSLGKQIDDILSQGSLVTKAIGWAKASSLLDDLLLDQVCGTKAVDGGTQADAGCSPDKIASAKAGGAAPATAPTPAPVAAATPSPTQAKAQAVWGLARALAQLSDANGSRWRSAQWLLAAKAIVAAQKADADLKLEQAKTVLAAQQLRIAALTREAVFLQSAQLSEIKPRPDCHSGLPGGDTGPNAHCMLGAYIDAWNEGIIPSGVLAYRKIQVDRAFAVRRARIVAQKQRALASAALVTLRSHGAGGLKAALIAQALFDAVAIGAIFGG